MAETMRGAYDDYISELEKQRANSLAAMQSAQAANESAVRGQVDQLVSQIDALRPQYQQQYEDNARNAYVENMIAKRDLPQQLSAQGITGGLSESSALALESDYQNALQAYKRDYQNRLTDLDNQANQVRMQGNNQLASMAADYNSMLASANESYANSIAQAKLQAALDARDQAYQQQLLDWEREQFYAGLGAGGGVRDYSGTEPTEPTVEEIDPVLAAKGQNIYNAALYDPLVGDMNYYDPYDLELLLRYMNLPTSQAETKHTR